MVFVGLFEWVIVLDLSNCGADELLESPWEGYAHVSCLARFGYVMFGDIEFEWMKESIPRVAIIWNFVLHERVGVKCTLECHKCVNNTCYTPLLLLFSVTRPILSLILCT